MELQFFFAHDKYPVAVMLVTTLCWWFYDGYRFMLLTESLCWQIFSLCWWFFQCIKSFTNIFSNIRHQPRCHPNILLDLMILNRVIPYDSYLGKMIFHKLKDCDPDNVCEYDSSNVARFAYCLLVMGSFWITECIPISVTALLPYILFPLFGLGRFSIDNLPKYRWFLQVDLLENQCQCQQEQ